MSVQDVPDSRERTWNRNAARIGLVHDLPVLTWLLYNNDASSAIFVTHNPALRAQSDLQVFSDNVEEA